MSLLLRSIAGSYLYGLSRPDSDRDFYEVHSEPLENTLGHRERKTVQTIVDGVDITAVGLSHFVELASSGSHQALDAMFSERTEVDSLTGLRRGFRTGWNVIPVYSGTIVEIAAKPDPRKRKHAVRLAYNLHDMVETGRFNPTLSVKRAAHVLTVASLSDDDFYAELDAITPYFKHWSKR